MQIKSRNVSAWLLAGVVVAGAAGIQSWRMSRQGAAETSSAAVLRDLGAIVGMDGSRLHVVNVNLNVIPDPIKRAQGIEALRGLYSLTSLDLQDTTLSPSQVEILSRLRSLQSLVLTGCEVSEEALSQLARLSNLQAIYLTQMPITRTVIEPLSGLRALKILDLSATKVDGGLEPIARLKNLEWLLLRDLEIKDESLVALAACPELKRLTMTGCQCNPANIATLKSKVAGLAVEEGPSVEAEPAIEPQNANEPTP